MTQPDDRDLEEQFAGLRREQRLAAPAFVDVRARRERPQRHAAPIAWGLAAAVIVVVIGVLVARNGRRESPPILDLRAAHWTAPTDFLLNVPGNWMLRDLPRIATPASMQFDTVSYRRASS